MTIDDEAYQPKPFSARGSAVGCARDEHFDRFFAFYRKWKANLQTNKKGTTMNLVTYFNKMRILPLLIAAALVALVASAPIPAFATPICNVNTETLAVGHYPSGLLNLMCHDARIWQLITRVRGDSDVYVTRHTFPVGAHTGWHTHPGPSLITVVAGELTVYEANNPTCTPVVYHTGESFTDIGCGDVHLVRNEGTVCAQDVAVQIVPAGAARRMDADQPANCPMFLCASPTPCPQ